MSMSTGQAIITILITAAATAITRFLPFLLFPGDKPAPPIINYLARVLPYSVIGLLIVYCLKSVSPTVAPHGLPEAISIALICAVHVWRRNVLLSIAVGTVAYMLLTQFLF